MSRDHDASAPGPSSVSVVNPLERSDWDRSIAAFPDAGIFHSVPWCRVLHETYGYSPRYLVRSDGDRFHSALPLMEVKSWLTGQRGVSLPFTDAVEPLCPDGKAFQSLFEAAQQLGRERRWKYLECRGGRTQLQGSVPASTRFYNHQLDLSAGEAKLFGQLDDSAQRAIRKAERSGLTLEFSQAPGAMRDFYTLLCETRQRHGVPPQPFEFFFKIQQHILTPNLGWVVLARQGKTPIAGAVFFHFGRGAIYKFGASTRAHQPLRANNLVMWQAIQRLAAEGFATLDFGRTSMNNEGLRRFKLGWGTRERVAEYVRFDFRQETFVTATDDSSGWHNRVFNALPTWASRPIGAFLYPHVG